MAGKMKPEPRHSDVPPPPKHKEAETTRLMEQHKKGTIWTHGVADQGPPVPVPSKRDKEVNPRP